MSATCRQEPKLPYQAVMSIAVRDNDQLMSAIKSNGLPDANVDEMVVEYLRRAKRFSHDVSPFRRTLTKLYDIADDELPSPR